MDYFKYIDMIWPREFPGLSIVYGREDYGPLSIYVMVKYDNFCIKRIFNVGDMINDDAHFDLIRDAVEHMRYEVIEKGERRAFEDEVVVSDQVQEELVVDVPGQFVVGQGGIDANDGGVVERSDLYLVAFGFHAAKIELIFNLYDLAGFRKHVIPAMRCYRPQQLCHPSDG
jgi:hypothetical protein